jgi:capsid protein
MSSNGSYDLLDSANSKKRRRPSIETLNEDKLLGSFGRMEAINVGRNLARNYATAVAHHRQFKLNVVGAKGPKLSMQTDDDEANKAANREINVRFAKDPDARDDTHLTEVVANILTAVKREADVVVVFDDFDEDDGKLLFWEADQLTGLSEADWKRQTQFPAEQGYSQCEGVIIDRRGVVRGWIVTHNRGMAISKLEDTIILKRDRDGDPGTARLIKSPWRLNQLRGTAELLPAAADYQDSYEILASEQQSAKVASKFAGVVKQKEGAEESLLDSGIDPESIIDGSGTDIQTGAPLAENYDRMEALTGGYMEYLGPDDDFEILDFNRPNVHLQEFLEHTLVNAGAAQGLTKTYSTLKTSTAYTAFRGDMLIAWAQFYWDQKFLERRFLDWVTSKRLAWAMRKGRIQQLPEGWDEKMKFIWPKMPSIDPLKTANAIKQEIANGTTDYSELLGPDWREILTKLADQLAFAKEKGLTLSDAVATEESNGFGNE